MPYKRYLNNKPALSYKNIIKHIDKLEHIISHEKDQKGNNTGIKTCFGFILFINCIIFCKIG